ncbi:MAG: cell division protein ZapE [Pseudomonadota bacterium]|nr:cell division protein ZapE [Pseudomonadota bacterium]
MSPLQTVTARLRAEVEAHRLQFDGAQFSAAQRLDALSEELRVQSSTILRRLHAALPWLPGGSGEMPARGVYLWGGVGRGKTLLMNMFHASTAGAQRSHFYHFMRNVHEELASIKHSAQPLDIVARRLAARARVICLDEFFVADIADAMMLAGLFDGLFRRGVTLVATSNLPPQDLYRDGLQRQRFLPAIALIQAHVSVLHLDGGIDYRLRQLEQAPTYLDSNLPETPAALRQRFAALTGNAASGPRTLTIEGRELHALAEGQGTVCFRFSELCEGPRSQNDYIELARLYHTIFIENIPVFGPSDEDAARRLIMLIDEFYDRGVKIVVSAAAPPASLYRGERLHFEFERAASRLIEMQTHDYLARQHCP